MNLINKNLLLEELPLFQGLSTRELKVIEERASILEYKKGEVIYTEGSRPSAFYCLISGRVVIYTQDNSGNRLVLEYLHHGKYFGIISLLTNEPHSVTAECLNDSVLLVIEKEDFDFTLKEIPSLAIDLSRTLSRRLKRKDIHQKSIFESTIISVFSSYFRAGKTIYAFNLALSLKNETKKSVIVLDIVPRDKTHSLPHRLEIQNYQIYELSLPLSGEADALGNQNSIKDFIVTSKYGIGLACFYYKPDDESCIKRLLAILSFLVNDYHYIILDLPTIMDRPMFNLLNQSDLINILTSPEPVDLKKTHNLLERLKKEFNFPKDKIRVITNEYKLSKLNPKEQTDILKRDIFATLPKTDFDSNGKIVFDNPDCEYSRAVRRISRKIGDCQVGLVFGVGVAYGFCHIGVLKVIEENNIPIDVIAGSSMGAVIASLWAAGYSSSQILQIMQEFKQPKYIWELMDFTIPILGFIKGNKVYKLLKKYLGNRTFYDLRIPLKIVASDVKRKEPRVLDKGVLIDALMASCAMPGVFAPFKFKDEVLFDGGVIHPLPTEALFEMGVKKIIAVNVTPSREDVLRQYEKIKEQISTNQPQDSDKGYRITRRLKQFFKKGLKTNILDIIFSTIEALQSEVAQKEARLADLVLHPDTSGLYWLELHKSEEFVKRGEEEALRNLDKIWQIVNE